MAKIRSWIYSSLQVRSEKDAVNECRIKYRWEALDAEVEAIKQSRKNKTSSH